MGLLRIRVGLACAGVFLVGLVVASSASGFELNQIGDDDDFELPIYVTSDPSAANRLFVAELGGEIKLRTGGETSTFLDMSSIVQFDTNGGGEDGLTSIAFAPDFAQTRRFYAAYIGWEDTATANPGDMHVDQFTAAGDSAQLSSRHEVLIVPEENTPETYHYSGQLQFGLDGYLYLATGDGGPQEDPNGNAQSPTDLRGKLLRVDPRANGGYRIPSGNPFDDPDDGVLDEIWSFGLRNPWRFSFDRKTGDLTIADVGHNAREEVDYEPGPAGGRGANFGWNCREGTSDTDFGSGGCGGPFTDPVLERPHTYSPCDSITGGYVVRDPGLEELRGRYVYSDWCTGALRSAVLRKPTVTDDRSEGRMDPFGPSSFGEDACGRIYVVDLHGPVYRLEDPTPTSAECVAARQPAPQEDSRAPSLDLDGKGRRGLAHSRRIKLRFTSDEDATLDVEGEVEAGPSRKSASARARSFRLAAKQLALEGGVERTASWKLGRRRVKRLRRALRRGRSVKALFAYTATDRAGNRTEGERGVRLSRR